MKTFIGLVFLVSAFFVLRNHDTKVGHRQMTVETLEACWPGNKLSLTEEEYTQGVIAYAVALEPVDFTAFTGESSTEHHMLNKGIILLNSVATLEFKGENLSKILKTCKFSQIDMDTLLSEVGYPLDVLSIKLGTSEDKEVLSIDVLHLQAPETGSGGTIGGSGGAGTVSGGNVHESHHDSATTTTDTSEILPAPTLIMPTQAPTEIPYSEFGCSNNADVNIPEGASGSIADGDPGVITSEAGQTVTIEGNLIVVVSYSNYTVRDVDGNLIQGIWACMFNGNPSSAVDERVQRQRERRETCLIRIDDLGNITRECDETPTPTPTETGTPTETASPTTTETVTLTSSTETATPTPTETGTPTPTESETQTPTPDDTATPTETLVSYP
jgi:hypothetical protein